MTTISLAEAFSFPHFCRMPLVLCREITRRNPFKIQKQPWITKVYSYPFVHWDSLGRQALFGSPFFLLFLLFQKFYPSKIEGGFIYKIRGQDKLVKFNALNTQFHALYFKNFAWAYEPQLSALMDLLLPEDGVFYDIGSNWGWFSFYLASKQNFRGVIHAFEPFPSSYQDLCSLIKQTGLSEQIHPHDQALSDHVGVASMRLPDHFQSGQAIMEESSGKDAGHTQLTTLDSLNLVPPFLIKADVEGSEIRVFKGGKKLLSEHKPMLVFENGRQNDNPKLTLEPLTFLHELGYRFFQIGWLRNNDGKKFFIGEDIDPDPQRTEILALTSFEWNERFLRSNGMNIFACHEDKIPLLKKSFEEYSPGNQ